MVEGTVVEKKIARRMKMMGTAINKYVKFLLFELRLDVTIGFVHLRRGSRVCGLQFV
jgi:hypothetical protein